MHVYCDLPEGAAVYAAIDGRIEIAGSPPWIVMNVFYAAREDGFLIYRLHGEWEVIVSHGTDVTQGTLLAVAVKPLSDEQAPSLSLGRGQFMEMGFANVELPLEISALWQ